MNQSDPTQFNEIFNPLNPFTHPIESLSEVYSHWQRTLPEPSFEDHRPFPKCSFLKFFVWGRALVVGFNRPEKLNALNIEVLENIHIFYDYLNKNVSLIQKTFSTIILTGLGSRAFIAGADIAEMNKLQGEEALHFGRLGQGATLKIENFPMTTIGMIHGHCLGGGQEIALSCDFLYASQTSTFGQPEVKLGLIPGFGGTQRLPKWIGLPRAREMIYSGKIYSATEASQWGLVNCLFDSESALYQGTWKFIEFMIGNSPAGVATAKKALSDGITLTVEAGLERELQEFTTLFGSAEMKEGTGAFVEKRKPRYFI